MQCIKKNSYYFQVSEFIEMLLIGIDLLDRPKWRESQKKNNTWLNKFNYFNYCFKTSEYAHKVIRKNTLKTGNCAAVDSYRLNIKLLRIRIHININ